MNKQISSSNWWARNAIGRTNAMREIPFSVLRALVLLGGRATATRIASMMAISVDDAEYRLSTWIILGAVAKRRDRYQLLPESIPPPPRRSRRWRGHRLHVPPHPARGAA